MDTWNTASTIEEAEKLSGKERLEWLNAGEVRGRDKYNKIYAKTRLEKMCSRYKVQISGEPRDTQSNINEISARIQDLCTRRPELDTATADQGLYQTHNLLTEFVNKVGNSKDLSLEDTELCIEAIRAYLSRYFKHTECLADTMEVPTLGEEYRTIGQL
jgi:hypothetical protein